MEVIPVCFLTQFGLCRVPFSVIGNVHFTHLVIFIGSEDIKILNKIYFISLKRSQSCEGNRLLKNKWMSAEHGDVLLEDGRVKVLGRDQL